MWVQGLESRGLELRVEGLRFWVLGVGFRVYASGSGVEGLCERVSGFRVETMQLRIAPSQKSGTPSPAAACTHAKVNSHIIS